MLTQTGPDESQKELIRQKREELEKRDAQALSPSTSDSTVSQEPSAANRATPDDGFPPDARLCGKCNHRAAIIMDGCVTCLNCGDSKCG